MFNSNKFYELEDEFNYSKNSHSYIFYTNDFFRCEKDLSVLVKKIFNVEDLNNVESDYFIIKKSENKNILKQEIENLKTFFQNTTYLNKYRIYQIEEAHKLNSSSANMILKFLEEPSDGVIAFFITTNLDAVLPTIKSRCQIINVFYGFEKQNIEENSILKKFIYDNNKFFSIIKAKKTFEKFERGELIELFNNYLDECYKNIDEEQNIKMIKVLNKAITMLNNNVNFDYVFDYLFLGSGDTYEYSEH